MLNLEVGGRLLCSLLAEEAQSWNFPCTQSLQLSDEVKPLASLPVATAPTLELR